MIFDALNNKGLGGWFAVLGGVALGCGAIRAMMMRTAWRHSSASDYLGMGAECTYYENNANHGLIMIFWALMPVLVSGTGNYAMPGLCGMPEVIYYRWNQQSLPMLGWTVPVGLISRENGETLGWTLSEGGADLLVALFFNGVSSLITTFNIVVTFLASGSSGGSGALCGKLDGGGLLFIASYLALSMLYILSLPGLNLGVIDKMAAEVWQDGGICDEDTFGHLFWLFGHPEVYVLIIPVWASWNANMRTVSSQTTLLMSLVGIFMLALLVWGHHLFTTAMELDSRVMFGVCSLVIAIPTGTKLYSWMWQHKKR